MKTVWNTEERGSGEATKVDTLRNEFKAAFLPVIPLSYLVHADCLDLCASTANICKQIISCFHGWITSKYLNGPDLETNLNHAPLCMHVSLCMHHFACMYPSNIDSNLKEVKNRLSFDGKMRI